MVMNQIIKEVEEYDEQDDYKFKNRLQLLVARGKLDADEAQHLEDLFIGGDENE